MRTRKRRTSSAKSACSSECCARHIHDFPLTFFFCFRHADREVVLEHVKSHYRDDGTPQEKQSGSSAELAAPPPPLPIQMPFQIMNNLLNGHAGTSTSTANVHNRNLLTLGGGASQLQASNSNASSTHQTLNFNSQNTLTTPSSSSSSHDAGKNNNGMPETNATSSSLKGSFRCGHCGQISNWKHVIQVYTNSFLNTMLSPPNLPLKMWTKIYFIPSPKTILSC
jgi:hypothetical protein